MLLEVVFNIVVFLLLAVGFFWARKRPIDQRHWSAVWFLNSIYFGLGFGGLFLLVVLGDKLGAWEYLGADKGATLMMFGLPTILGGILSVASAMLALLVMYFNWVFGSNSNSSQDSAMEREQ